MSFEITMQCRSKEVIEISNVEDLRKYIAPPYYNDNYIIKVAIITPSNIDIMRGASELSEKLKDKLESYLSNIYISTIKMDYGTIGNEIPKESLDETLQHIRTCDIWFMVKPSEKGKAKDACGDSSEKLTTEDVLDKVDELARDIWSKK